MLGSKDEFLAMFNGIKKEKDIKEERIFFDPIYLRDYEIGFSVKVNYPKQIKYFPLRTKNGGIDEVCLIHLIFKKDGKFSYFGNPLIVKCHKISKYLSKEGHLDFNFDDEDCPTRESIDASRKTAKFAPKDFVSYDLAFIDSNSNQLVDLKGREIKGMELLEKIFDYHIKISKTIAGIPFRSKIRFRNILVGLLEMNGKLVRFCLRMIFGRTLKSENPTMANLVEGYKKQDMVLSKVDSLSIFGYEASKRVILTFCFLMIIFYSLFFTVNFKPLFIVQILKNSLLSLVFTIFVLEILNTLIPNILLSLLNFIIKLKFQIRFGKN
jgi:hypothetical protein